MKPARRELAAWIERCAPRDMPASLRRRALLRGAYALAAGALAAPLAGRAAATNPSFGSDPFTLGVASGAPRSDSVVLWTRLAPVQGEVPAAIDVKWEIARDDKFRTIVQHGSTTAAVDVAHSVHVEVKNLEPARWYFYRFTAGDAISATGRTLTAPQLNAADARLHFAFASCQQYEQGYYAAYRHMARENLDLVVFLGDYIYESSWGRNHVRKHDAGMPFTLDAYRNRYALYKRDPDLQLMHASAPWLVTWDDHEVNNDYANDRSETLDPDFLLRRAAAYRAWYEHMPVPLTALPRGPDALVYDSYRFGTLANFFVLDDRQFRAYEACPKPGRGGSNVVSGCAERIEPGRTMLGETQERWLANGLRGSRTRWNILAQQTLMAQNDRMPGPGESFWTDGWDGYPAARTRLLDELRESRVANPLVISGDVHCTWVADLKTDFADEKSPTVATEFCGTSITSQGPNARQVTATLRENPHIKYGNSTRGYLAVDLAQDHCNVTVRGLADEKLAASGIATLATFAVESGRPGALKT